MRRARWTKISAVCSTIAAALLISAWLLSAQNGAQEAKAEPAVTSTIYNPYPPGILPPDLNLEILRVLREIDFIENESVGQWHALMPPTVAGNPPILQNTGVASVEILGKLMNFDKNISPFKNTACASCHMPYAGFSGPIPSVNLT
ncbi:MAG: hypothetical protein M3Z96_04755, partial [Pseudomonadota bacterium]|nr:hypothetical protein [Pseudomonadota bacterium]